MINVAINIIRTRTKGTKMVNDIYNDSLKESCVVIKLYSTYLLLLSGQHCNFNDFSGN